jgi:hypothetical protein
MITDAIFVYNGFDLMIRYYLTFNNAGVNVQTYNTIYRDPSIRSIMSEVEALNGCYVHDMIYTYNKMVGIRDVTSYVLGHDMQRAGCKQYDIYRAVHPRVLHKQSDNTLSSVNNSTVDPWL